MGSEEESKVVVGVAVYEIVTVVVSLSLGDVEPDVRLKITRPTGRENGAELPCVLWLHALIVELNDPQQKESLVT